MHCTIIRYYNEENVSFSIVDNNPDYSFNDLHFTPKNEIELYPVIKAGFTLKSLCIHIASEENNIGLHYLGLKGFGNKNKRGVVDTRYEVLSTKAEDKGDLFNVNHQLI